MKVPVAIIDAEGGIVATNTSWDEFPPLYNHDRQKLIELEGLFHSSQLQNSVVEMWKGERAQIDYHFKTIHRVHHILTVTNNNKNLFLQVRKSDEPPAEVEENAIDIVENMTDAFFSLDANWCFTYLNEEAELLFDRKRKSMLGRHLWNVFPQARVGNFEYFYRKSMTERIDIQFEEYYEHLHTWFEVRIYPNKLGGISVYFKNNNATKELEQSLWKAANTDFLTSLPNRRFAYDQMKQLIDENVAFSLFFLDLNQFKVINDLYGHDVGDQLIRLVGERLLSRLPKQYDIARLGGDEFLIIVKETGAEDKIKKIGKQIIVTFNEPFAIESLPDIYIDPSVGVSQFPYDGIIVDTLIDKADIAMYEAKKNLTKEAVIYSPCMHELVSRDLTIQQEMKKVVERKELTFVYQPQVDSRSGQVTGVEVLTRWEHPVLGHVSPATFIPIAESSGMIEKITRYQIKTCLQEYIKWIQQYGYEGKIAFNISSALFPNKSFIIFFTETIQKYGISFDKIEVEITENIQLFSNKESINNLAYLRKLGIYVSIDDFGTGYSTLSYLYDFPVDKVKIDKLFIDQINQGEKGEAVLIAIIKLAQSLNLDVIAEGVETKEQHDFLMHYDCYSMQGYYHYRPMDRNQWEDFYTKFLQKRKIEARHSCQS